MTMATTIEQQVALDEALVPSTQRLRIERSNLRLPSDIQSKESTLQLFYDVLRRCPFFKAFLVTADVPEIYMQEFWATAYVHQHFVYQVEQKKSNEMYYLRFTKVIIHQFMSKDPSIPRRNNIKWHYVRDDSIFSTIKVVSRHQNTQQYGAMLPIELTNDKIRNTKAYKEYYALATGEVVPKPKASARRKRSGSDTSITPPTATTTPTTTVAVTPKLTATAKGKQPAKAKSLSDASEIQMKELVLNQGFRMYPLMNQKKNSYGTLLIMKVLMIKKRNDDDQDQEIVKHDDKDDTEESRDVDEEGESDEEDDNEETRDGESFDPIPQTPESSEDEGNGKEDQVLRISEEERLNEEEEAEELYKDVNINQGKGIQATLDVKDSHVTLTLVHPDGQQESSSVSSHFVTSMLNPPSDAGMESIFVTASSSMAPLQTSTTIMTPSTIATITTISHAQIPPMTIPSEVLQNLPTFDSVFRFEDRLKSLDASFSEYRQINPFVEAISNISGIVHQYTHQQMTEASVNAQLEAEVLTRSSHSSRTSYAVAADLSKIELKKIVVDKMKGNKETIILKKRRDDDDDQDERPFAGSDRGSKRQREGKEPESTSSLLETATRIAGRSTTGSKSRQVSVSESAFAEEPVQTTSQMEKPSYPVFEQVQIINPLFNSLSILNGFFTRRNLQLRIVIGTRPYL
uniref:Uncharacterized protein n=1 Tax=Tanacetum cinerariifolium TaxID=118510 RepID=A0A699JMS6_TANCI|nr:hypothetical protein [Tanacetum cinerariifolium]